MPSCLALSTPYLGSLYLDEAKACIYSAFSDLYTGLRARELSNRCCLRGTLAADMAVEAGAEGLQLAAAAAAAAISEMAGQRQLKYYIM
jgi:hypothetical protein